MRSFGTETLRDEEADKLPTWSSSQPCCPGLYQVKQVSQYLNEKNWRERDISRWTNEMITDPNGLMATWLLFRIR